MNNCLTSVFHAYCTSRNSSSAVVLNNFASVSRLEVLGSDAPVSHLETACLLTPIDSATNSCVILHSSRCCFKTSPRDFLMMDFSFLTLPDLTYLLNALMRKIPAVINAAITATPISSTMPKTITPKKSYFT